MKEHLVYILYSQKHRKIYCGVSSNLIARFKSHNTLGKTGWTIKFRPWQVIYLEVYQTRTEALKRESFLKSGLGRKWIKDHILDDIPQN